uniref:Uncharacterized protein n=1 Tax=Anopheles maculatus TaxID=74869 RepID=A0A182SY12_9DIPT
MKPYDNGTFAPRHFVTEWEDNVVFDADDPDFSAGGNAAAAAAAATNALMRSASLASSNLTRSVTTYYGLNSASVVSNLNQLMKGKSKKEDIVLIDLKNALMNYFKPAIRCEMS